MQQAKGGVLSYRNVVTLGCDDDDHTPERTIATCSHIGSDMCPDTVSPVLLLNTYPLQKVSDGPSYWPVAEHVTW